MASAGAMTVVIQVFGLFHPTSLEISPGAPGVALQVACPDAAATTLEGARTLRLKPGCTASGLFTLSVPGRIRRTFSGSLRVEPGLTALITMDLEVAVASVVAAEMPSTAPAAALEAQAIAARSYFAAAASRGRHAYGSFCDTTHCQHVRGVIKATHPASQAARRTAGLVLYYDSRVLGAMYSAACQGTRQAGSAEESSPSGEYLYFSVPCDACRRTPANLRGIRHFRGLCQRGASAMAAGGRDASSILLHYYPGTRIQSLFR